MKPHYYSRLLYSHVTFAVLIVFFPLGCKKDDIPISRVTDSEKSDVASDGIVSVQASILSPATTGDTGWALNKLPLNFASNSTEILKCKLPVKHKEKNVSTNSDSVQVYSGGIGQTTIQFTGGFKHTGGTSEILKIYAPIGKSGAPRILRTTLFPLGGFEWVDGLGAILHGAKNAKFFKEPTGQSEFNH